jgi:hypothetical protein
MSFSPEWLALREPADHEARSIILRNHLQAQLADRDKIGIIDLGCGTGSNLRALAPHLSREQNWRLVDYDQTLLDAAKAALQAWANEATHEDGALVLRKDRKTISVVFDRVDLAVDLEKLLARKPDLVTAAAFFDLVSPEWIERFCDALAANRLMFFTVLTYDGLDRWLPPHQADEAMQGAFHAHQGTDKGFGKAAGPQASNILQQALTRHRYRVIMEPSPWKLGQKQRALMNALSDGFANAVAETRMVPEDVVASWRAARRDAVSCEVGHYDLLGLPSAD